MEFKDRLMESGILDPIGTHHEFASGSHGRKLDFDLLAEDSDLYKEWVDINAQVIKQDYSPLPNAVLGVANGTNRLARDVAKLMGIPGLVTQKATKGKVELTEESCQLLNNLSARFILVLEDVGTSGGTAYSAVRSAFDNGADKSEILFSWQRTDELTALSQNRIPFKAIIKETIPTYSVEQCVENGYCSMGWNLVTRS